MLNRSPAGILGLQFHSWTVEIMYSDIEDFRFHDSHTDVMLGLVSPVRFTRGEFLFGQWLLTFCLSPVSPVSLLPS